MEAVLVSAGVSASTAATISTIATVASAASSILQGVQQKRAADFNAAIATQNADIARQQASVQEAAFRRQARGRAGAAKAAAGASGISAEGSSLDILEDNAIQEELSALTIRHQGALKATGFLTEAQLEKHRGRSALTKGVVGAGTSLLQSDMFKPKTGITLAGKATATSFPGQKLGTTSGGLLS